MTTHLDLILLRDTLDSLGCTLTHKRRRFNDRLLLVQAVDNLIDHLPKVAEDHHPRLPLVPLLVQVLLGVHEVLDTH